VFQAIFLFQVLPEVAAAEVPEGAAVGAVEEEVVLD